MACCYLIQSHTQPDQILRLVETIKRSSPDARVLVAHDATSCSLDPTPFEKHAHVRVIAQKVRVARGELSVLAPLFAGLEELLGGKAAGHGGISTGWSTSRARTIRSGHRGRSRSPSRRAGWTVS